MVSQQNSSSIIAKLHSLPSSESQRSSSPQHYTRIPHSIIPRRGTQ